LDFSGLNAEYNIYCDESCHLEKDNIPIILWGGMWCERKHIKKINNEIKTIKIRNNLPPDYEIKWKKVSKNKLHFFRELVTYFYSSPLNFRALLVPDASCIRHEEFFQDHNTWYYKMYYEMLKQILSSQNNYNIYLDIKDTESSLRIKSLKKFLTIKVKTNDLKIQTIQSHESQILQLTDFFLGALGYTNRKLASSEPKLDIIKKIQELNDFSLTNTTPYYIQKINLLVWEGR